MSELEGKSPTVREGLRPEKEAAQAAQSQGQEGGLPPHLLNQQSAKPKQIGSGGKPPS